MDTYYEKGLDLPGEKETAKCLEDHQRERIAKRKSEEKLRKIKKHLAKYSLNKLSNALKHMSAIIREAGDCNEERRQNIANEIKELTKSSTSSLNGILSNCDVLVRASEDWSHKNYNNRVGYVHGKKESPDGVKLYCVSINSENGENCEDVWVPRANLTPVHVDLIIPDPPREPRRLQFRLRESRRRRLSIIRRLQGF